MFVMKLEPEYFDLVRSGKKIYEIRLNDEKRSKIGIGDNIIFKKLPDLIEGVVVKVVDVKRFDSFEDMAKVLSLSAIGLEGKTATQVSEIYHGFYSAEDEKKYGVVAFKIELM